MKHLILTQLPHETDAMWQLRLSNMFYAMERLISVLRQENMLLRENHRAEFDLTADTLPALLRRQV